MSEKESDAVARVVRENWVSSAGPDVGKFEAAVAEYCGIRFGAATVNGTSALHIALLIAGVTAGDLVPVSNLTFIAAANAVTYTGAEPVLFDINPENFQMDIDLLAEWLDAECEIRETECFHRESGKRVPAVVWVHALGYLADMDRVVAVCEKWHLRLIEDAAEAMGSFRDGKHAGTWGFAGALSFNGNKIMTSGGGGMVLVNTNPLAEHARHLSQQARIHKIEYMHDEVGYNYRMPNLNAALGLAQLERMPEFLEKKQHIDGFYRYALAEIPDLVLPPIPEESQSPNHWFFPLRHPDSSQLEEFLSYQNIDARPIWVPLNRLPPYSGVRHITRENHAYSVYDATVCLPCSTGITQEELETTAIAVGRFFDVNISL